MIKTRPEFSGLKVLSLHNCKDHVDWKFFFSLPNIQKRKKIIKSWLQQSKRDNHNNNYYIKKKTVTVYFKSRG